MQPVLFLEQVFFITLLTKKTKYFCLNLQSELEISPDCEEIISKNYRKTV